MYEVQFAPAYIRVLSPLAACGLAAAVQMGYYLLLTLIVLAFALFDCGNVGIIVCVMMVTAHITLLAELFPGIVLPGLYATLSAIAGRAYGDEIGAASRARRLRRGDRGVDCADGGARASHGFAGSRGEHETMIQIENLSKRYGKNEILRQITVRFESGGIYGLVGANGCGKRRRCAASAGSASRQRVCSRERLSGRRTAARASGGIRRCKASGSAQTADFAPKTGVIIESPGFRQTMNPTNLMLPDM